MPPTFVLADLYAREFLPRTAYSARPDAPIQPAVPRWARLRLLSRSARHRFATSTRQRANLEHTPAGQYS